MSLYDYLNKPSEIPESTLDLKRDDVLLFICRKGAGFTTEIARQCDINVDGINQILYHLNKDKFIEKIFPNPDQPQPQFRARMKELWATGIISYPSISKFSWWTLTEGGFEFIKAKFEGQSKTISGSLVKTLNLKEIIIQEPFQGNKVTLT